MTELEHVENSEEALGPEVMQLPPFQRKFHIAPLQIIGISLLLLLPLAALFGFFSENVKTVRNANSVVAMQVDYPTRLRYTEVEPLTVAVTNLSAQSPATITVAVARAYMDSFSEITIDPEVNRITDDAYVVELGDVTPGATEVVKLSIQGEVYWRQTGEITVSLSDGESVSVTVSSLVFP